MSENQRESFRVEPDDATMHAELFHEGRVAPCTLHNLSAGGARVTSRLALRAGTQCTLGVRLTGALLASAPKPYVSFHMEVLDATPITAEGSQDATPSFDYRLRSITGPGSSEYEGAAKLVFAAQRRELSATSGAEPATPMVSERERRRTFWLPRRRRFSRDDLRPGSGD